MTSETKRRDIVMRGVTSQKQASYAFAAAERLLDLPLGQRIVYVKAVGGIEQAFVVTCLKTRINVDAQNDR